MCAIKFKKLILRIKKFFGHAYNSQLIQRTHLWNSHEKKILSFWIIPILTLTAKNDQDLQKQCHK
jgi:hypothetical protein